MFKPSKNTLKHWIFYYEKTIENAIACHAPEKSIEKLQSDLQNAKNELKTNYPK